jgi:hypothetical protein
MIQIVQLVKNGSSLSFNITKALKRERLDWKENDYFTVTANHSGELVISRLKLKQKTAVKTKNGRSDHAKKA